MKSFTTAGLLGAALLAAHQTGAAAVQDRDVDTTYPYEGPEVPVGDWVDPTINGNGKGFPRLVEPPAVKPHSKHATNNVNVISISYLPKGVNIHFQTPFGLGKKPSIYYGRTPFFLNRRATGETITYGRTPSCSQVKAITQCSEYFHNVELNNLKPDTTYFYQIPAANGTTKSHVLSFKTGRAAGKKGAFKIAVLNDMGYTNAKGTHKYLTEAAEKKEIAFAWHGGDLSYADDWYSGILPCTDDWPVCYNGSSTELPGPAPVPDEYKNTPLPAGEVANQGGPQGGDMSVIYESNWDLWQQWMGSITTKIPYQVLPGNHEATCAEFDGDANELSAYLDHNKPNSTQEKSDLNYYSCPPSQRNFTAFQHRFTMKGEKSKGVGNFWYSFDYGLAHFVSIDSETDFPKSSSHNFGEDIDGTNETHPTPEQTYSTDAGPFGTIDGSYADNKAYEQWNWLDQDLAGVDRKKTPWVFVMAHRPLYSSQVSSYQPRMRNAWEGLMLKHGVDAYFAGHIHWYERLLPLGLNGTIDKPSVKDNNTYYANNGKSITYITNGAAGNIESHSTISGSPLNITQFLDFVHFGFGKLEIDQCKATWNYIFSESGKVGDHLTLLKKDCRHY